MLEFIIWFCTFVSFPVHTVSALNKTGFSYQFEKSVTHLLYYRPQRSCGKVIFSQTSVILLTGGVCSGGVVSQHALRQTPPQSRHHPPGQPPPEQTPPRADTPRDQNPPQDQTPPRADTPRTRPLGPDVPGADTPTEQTSPWIKHPPEPDTSLGPDTPQEQTPPREQSMCKMCKMCKEFPILFVCKC